MKNTLKFIKSFVVLCVLFYIIFGITLYLNQKSYIYFPTSEVFKNDVKSTFLKSGEEKIKLWILNPNKEKAIIYFGGNAESVDHNIDDFISFFPQHTVYLVNYRGYGGSSGDPSQKGIFEDALNIYDEVYKTYQDVSIIGRSLGTGVSVYLASQKDVDTLVLITPYDSIQSIASSKFPMYPMSILLKDKYDSYSLADKIQAKVLVLIAKDDKVVPNKNTNNLISVLKQPKIHMIKNVTHSTISHSQMYKDVLKEFFK